jgi:hypothetical protein
MHLPHSDLYTVTIRDIATRLEADHHEPGWSPYALLFAGKPYRVLLLRVMDHIAAGMLHTVEQFLERRP